MQSAERLQKEGRDGGSQAKPRSRVCQREVRAAHNSKLPLLCFSSQFKATMASSSGDRDQAAATAAMGTPGKQQQPAKFNIPPLTKSTEAPLDIRRRLDLQRSEEVLTEQLNKLSLESRQSAKTPRKPAGTVPTTPGTSRPKAAAMPSPGLRKIRERLGGGGGTSTAPSAASRSKEEREADEAAARAVAEAEASAADAIDNVLAQQEGLLAAMSVALRSGSGDGGSSNSNNSHSSMQSSMLDKVARAVEETTREQLAALSGVAKGGDEIRGTVVYWITMARFEESHGRIDVARTYLVDGIEHMEGLGDCASSSGGSGKNTTQINALRLALERLDKRVASGGEKQAGDENIARVAETTSKPKAPKLPPSASGEPASDEAEQSKEKNTSSPARRPRRRSVGKVKSPSSAAVTPTRRSSRIKSRSAEKGK